MLDDVLLRLKNPPIKPSHSHVQIEQRDFWCLISAIETLTAEKEKLAGALSKPSVWAALTPSGKILEIQFGEQRPLMLPPFSNQDFPTWVGFIEVTEALASVGKGDFTE